MRCLCFSQVCGPPGLMNLISGDKAKDKSQGEVRTVKRLPFIRTVVNINRFEFCCRSASILELMNEGVVTSFHFSPMIVNTDVRLNLDCLRDPCDTIIRLLWISNTHRSFILFILRNLSIYSKCCKVISKCRLICIFLG